MIGPQARQLMRAKHRPIGPERKCAFDGQPEPCDAILALNEVENVEALARTETDRQGREIARLRGEVTALRSRINAAIEVLSE
jgi:hypothetical protein